MNYTVNLTDREAEELVKFHQSNIDRCQLKLADITAEMVESQKRIAHILNAKNGLFQPVLQGLESSVYSNYWTLSDKAEYVLKKRGKISTTRRIADLIDEEEHGFYSENKKIGDLVSKLGATLKQKVDKGAVFSRLEVGGDIFYGLSDWFADDNKILSTYVNFDEIPFDLDIKEKTSSETDEELSKLLE
jgi:hypothetical protein